MKLFIWKDVLTDYTSGMIVALAPDLETALSEMDSALGREEMGRVDPEIIEVATDAKPKIWYVWGGG